MATLAASDVFTSRPVDRKVRMSIPKIRFQHVLALARIIWKARRETGSLHTSFSLPLSLRLLIRLAESQILIGDQSEVVIDPLGHQLLLFEILLQ